MFHLNNFFSVKEMNGIYFPVQEDISKEYLLQSRRNKNPYEKRLFERQFDWVEFPLVDAQKNGISTNDRIGVNTKQIIRELQQKK